MELELLNKFTAETKISVRTLKAKYSDCIYREGRQSFINRKQFEEVFPIRSRQGRITKRPIVKSTHLGQVEFHLNRIEAQLEKAKRAVKTAMGLAKTAEPARKERLLIVYLDEQKKLKTLEVKSQKWIERRNALIAKKKAELAAFDTEGLLGSA